MLSTTLLLSVARGPHLSSMLTLISPDSGIRVIDYPFITSSPKSLSIMLCDFHTSSCTRSILRQSTCMDGHVMVKQWFVASRCHLYSDDTYKTAA